ncbi:MAG: hypothetical protein J6V53_01850 [Alphaproteobacteria bacterium]|nr:hypothetical protein [Alphaproteobacteria bacterium]
MKKIFLSLCSICLILSITACTDETNLSTSAIIFTRPECTSTDQALRFFRKLQNKTGIITYEIKDLSIAQNRILIKKFAKKHHISGQNLYTPIIFTPKGYSSGWNKQTEENLKFLLNVRE